ncbi:NADP-dependent alkenal double bond reductase p1-like protein, partial [Trifolium pratense]
LSVDPYLRGRITGILEGLFISQYQLNQVITAFAVVRVIRSNDSKYSEGDILLNPNASVAEYSIVPSSQITRKIDTSNGISLSDYLGALAFGMTLPHTFKDRSCLIRMCDRAGVELLMTPVEAEGGCVPAGAPTLKLV